MVTVLILGGLGLDATRHLITHLLSAHPSAAASEHRPLAFVRIVDKSLAIPQVDAYTTYVDSSCRQALKAGVECGTVEYIQANLLTQPSRDKAFTLPDAHGGPSAGFDWVFDFTGETDFNAPELVHLERTIRIALLLGQAAVEHRAGVYVRTLTPFYRIQGGEGKARVGGDRASGSKEGVATPWGTMASWHHEAARGLAMIKGLNLVCVRPALFYGPYTLTGLTPRALLAEVYKFQGEKLDFLWAESLSLHTVHAQDFASALVSTAAWAQSVGHDAALTAQSEPLPSTLSSDDQLSPLSASGLNPARKADSVRAVVFSVCDDGETTQKDIARVIEDVVGVESGFHGSVISTFAKLNICEVAEDINDKHLVGWSALLQASDPPISSAVPISPYVPIDLLRPNPIAFDNSALKRLIGWSPRYKLDSQVVRETVEGFQKEGHWPHAKPIRKAKK